MKERTITISAKTIILVLISVAVIVVAVYFATTAGSANYGDNTVGIGLEKSIAVALQDAGYQQSDVTNLRSHLGRDDGTDVYDVQFVANGYVYEYTVRAADGEILDADIETPDGQVVTPDQTKDIGLEAAKEAALADKGFTATEVDFLKTARDVDDGILIYDIEFIAGDYKYEYEITGSDGSIHAFSKEKVVSSQPPASSTGGANTSGSTGSNAGSGGSAGSSGNTATSGSSGTAGSQKPNTSYISVEQAKTIALHDAGVSASDAIFSKVKLDRDDGVSVYEVEFTADRVEYDYELHAATGVIREKSSEPVDDWDDDWDDHEYDHEDDHWDDHEYDHEDDHWDDHEYDHEDDHWDD